MPVLQIGCRFAGRLGLISGLSAARFGRESRCQTSTLRLPGAFCVTTVTTGSHPEPSVLVVHSSPDLVAATACQSCCGASTMVESERWLKVKWIRISSDYPLSATLIHTRAFVQVSCRSGRWSGMRIIAIIANLICNNANK